MTRKIIGKMTKYILVAISSLFVMQMSSFAGFYSNKELVDKSADCLTCHDTKQASLEGTAHQMNTEGHAQGKIGVGCVGCHEGWEKHLEDPSAETINNPATLSAMDQVRVCGECHLDPHEAGMVSSDPHVREGVGCLSCHTVHGNHNPKLVKDDGADFCATCHTPIVAEFKRRTVHPLEDGNISCIDCQHLCAIKDPMLARGIDWTCQNCHSEKSGPFIHEHPVTLNYLVNGGGCVECHEPHGAPNERLLRQPGNGLCLQCHTLPPLHRTQHSGLGAKADCVLCHTDIHGSNVNRIFLDPNLTTKFVADCYQAGCHVEEN